MNNRERDIKREKQLEEILEKVRDIHGYLEVNYKDGVELSKDLEHVDESKDS